MSTFATALAPHNTEQQAGNTFDSYIFMISRVVSLDQFLDIAPTEESMLIESIGNEAIIFSRCIWPRRPIMSCLA